MPINYVNEIRSALESKGAITTDTIATEDLSGNFPNITVEKIKGITALFTALQIGDSIIYDGTNLVNAQQNIFADQILTANATAEKNKNFLCNTTSAAFTITCPSSPSAGDRFKLYDSHGNFATNSVTILPHSGGTISGGGVDDGIVLNVTDTIAEMLYNGTEWRIYPLNV